MIIQGAMICDANSEQRGDVRIEGSQITQVSCSILPRENEMILDAKDLINRWYQSDKERYSKYLEDVS